MSDQSILLKVSNVGLKYLWGFVIGNPVTTPTDDNYSVPFSHGIGLISDELYEVAFWLISLIVSPMVFSFWMLSSLWVYDCLEQSLKRNCKGKYQDIDPSNFPCSQDLQVFNKAGIFSFWIPFLYFPFVVSVYLFYWNQSCTYFAVTWQYTSCKYFGTNVWFLGTKSTKSLLRRISW